MPLDFTKGSIALDFAEKVAGAAAVETFERYHTVDLGAWASFIPADEGLFSSSLENPTLEIALQTGAPTWVYSISAVRGNDGVVGDGANLRIRNAGAAASNLIVMRHHISTGTYERYNTQDLAAGTSYTPADGGLFSHASEALWVDCEYKYNGAWWGWFVYTSAAAEISTLLAIGDGTNLRYHNTDGGAAEWVVIMRAIMVT